MPTVRQTAWQLRAAYLLADLLERAGAEELPVAVWEIGEIGPQLLGHCYGSLAAQRREVFDAWLSFLGAAQAADRIHEQDTGGVVLLIAQWNRYQGVEITLRALLDDQVKR
jgi:hypothetical protein